MLVSGEAGVGKSTPGRGARAADARPTHAGSWGACDGLFTPRPLGPLFDIADSSAASCCELLPEPAPRATSCSRRCCARSTRRRRLTSSSSRTCTGPTRRRSTCCGSSAGASGDARALILVTYRDDGSGRGRPAAGGARRAGHPAVDPPDQPGAAVGRGGRARWPTAPVSSRPSCYRLTGGNPFFVTEVLAAGAGELPPSARDAVLARVAGLEPRGAAGARRRRADRRPRRARRCWPRRPSLPEHLDELLGCGLLVGDGGGCGSATRSPGWRSSRRSRPPRAAARTGSSTRSCAAGCDDDARWRSTPRARATPRRAGTRAAAARHAAGLGVASRGRGAVRARPAVRRRRRRRRAGRALRRLADEDSLIDRWEDCAAARRARARAVARGRRPAARGRHAAACLADACGGCAAAPSRAGSRRRACECWSRSGQPRAGVGVRATSPTTGCTAASIDEASRARPAGPRPGRAARLPEVLSDALNTEACASPASAATGGRCCSGTGRSRSATAARSRPAGRTRTSTACTRVRRMRFAEAERYFVEGSPTATSTTSARSATACAASAGRPRCGWAAGTRRRRWPQDLLRPRALVAGQPDQPARSAWAGPGPPRRPGVLGVPGRGGSLADGARRAGVDRARPLARAEARWLEGDLAGGRRGARRPRPRPAAAPTRSSAARSRRGGAGSRGRASGSGPRRRAVRSRARGRPAEAAAALGRPRLPVRRGAGAARLGRRGGAARGAGPARRLGAAATAADRPAADARPRHPSIPPGPGPRRGPIRPA